MAVQIQDSVSGAQVRSMCGSSLALYSTLVLQHVRGCVCWYPSLSPLKPIGAARLAGQTHDHLCYLPSKHRELAHRLSGKSEPSSHCATRDLDARLRTTLPSRGGVSSLHLSSNASNFSSDKSVVCTSTTCNSSFRSNTWSIRT